MWNDEFFFLYIIELILFLFLSWKSSCSFSWEKGGRTQLINSSIEMSPVWFVSITLMSMDTSRSVTWRLHNLFKPIRSWQKKETKKKKKEERERVSENECSTNNKQTTNNNKQQTTTTVRRTSSDVMRPDPFVSNVRNAISYIFFYLYNKPKTKTRKQENNLKKIIYIYIYVKKEYIFHISTKKYIFEERSKSKR